MNSMPIFKTQQNRKAAPRASKKQQTTVPTFIKTIRENAICAISSMRKPRVEIAIQKSIKNDLERNPNKKLNRKLLEFTKADIRGSPTYSQIE